MHSVGFKPTTSPTTLLLDGKEVSFEPKLIGMAAYTHSFTLISELSNWYSSVKQQKAAQHLASTFKWYFKILKMGDFQMKILKQ